MIDSSSGRIVAAMVTPRMPRWLSLGVNMTATMPISGMKIIHERIPDIMS
jgi:hypothetical protein